MSSQARRRSGSGPASGPDNRFLRCTFFADFPVEDPAPAFAALNGVPAYAPRS
jgi:hypothetical protein